MNGLSDVCLRFAATLDQVVSLHCLIETSGIYPVNIRLKTTLIKNKEPVSLVRIQLHSADIL